ALFPYLKDGRTGAATNRNPWLTLESQWVEDIDDEMDEEIYDIDIDEEDGEYIDEIDEASQRPPAKQPRNRLILKRSEDVNDSQEADPTLKDVIDVEQPPGRFIPSAQQDVETSLGAGPNEDWNDLDEDLDDNEYVVGAWLRPMPRKKQNGGSDDLGSGW